MLKKVKDKLYYYFAEKNWGVRREYGPYVDAHQEEHAKQPWKHWWMLVRLNWHYRIMRRDDVLYRDEQIKKGQHVSLNPKSRPKATVSTNGHVPYINGSESAFRRPVPPQHFVKRLLPYDVISFDVFDTLIFRPFSRPTMVFEMLEIENGIRNFAADRVAAEKEMRIYNDEHYGTREVTLQEIYEYISNRTGLDVWTGMQTEIKREIELCMPNPYMKAVFDMLRGSGKRIIIASDMYLPEHAIRAMLTKCGFEGYEKLYVSGDLRKSKATGAMYELIQEEFGMDTSFVHIGDNPHSDIKMAQKAGWETRVFTNVNTLGTSYRAEGMSPVIQSAYNGIVNAHLHNGLNAYSGEYEYGFIYGGLYVLGYMNWVHNYAKLHQLDKVIFLARDGAVYKKVYDSLFDDIKSEYLYWSRAATIRYDIKKNFADFIRRTVSYRILNKEEITLEQILLSANLECLIDQLQEVGLEKNSYLTEENRKVMESFLRDRKNEVIAKYEKEAVIARANIKSILDGAKSVAFVDVGWAGSGAKALRNLIEHEWKINCSTHILVGATDSWNVDIERDAAYLFSPFHNASNKNAHFEKKVARVSNDLFEMLTQACEPSFKGYGDKSYSFALPTVEVYRSINEIMRGIVDFAHVYTESFRDYPYMMRISGQDAYIPFRFLLKHINYFKKNFAYFPIETNTGGGQPIPVSLEKYLKIKGV